ncbi:MAG: methyltransferase type 11 [Actinoallomurus sp.]|nr:methyltransferase type 11 [Actinoallomurus sp.]
MSGPLHGWGMADLLDDATLIASELVSNAAKLGQNFALALTTKGRILRIAVSDHSDAKPIVKTRPGDDWAEDGRGLLVVDALADAWGFDVRAAGGKVVWAEVTSSAGEPVVTVECMDRTPDITPEALARRASSFGGQAAAYAAERPGYPDTAIRWALEPVSDRTPLRVLDLAAGTGKLTAGLLRQDGVEIVAVEPDTAMLAELRGELPDVRTLAGSAEHIPLGDGSVDAVVVGQAMHWFDLDRALPEMSRVLAPGGVMAGLWNRHDDQVPWVKGFSEVSGRVTADGRTDFDASPYFAEMEHAAFPHSQRRTAESLAATVGTHSHVLVLDDGERAALTDRVLSYLRSTPETAGGEFDLPLVTVVVRAVRA